MRNETRSDPFDLNKRNSRAVQLDTFTSASTRSTSCGEVINSYYTAINESVYRANGAFDCGLWVPCVNQIAVIYQ